MSQSIYILSEQDHFFPHPNQALTDPNGLLAVGGDLNPKRLLIAYQQGIFPWFNHHDPILWWSPDPRAVLAPENVHISRSMKKFIKTASIEISINQAFNKVIQACAQPRENQPSSWIQANMIEAYQQLHQQGHAHSVEVWHNSLLVGGLYGVSIGGVFCGESMFHMMDNASKIAFIFLCQHWQTHGGKLIDCQIQNAHLASLGAIEIPRVKFLKALAQWKKIKITPNCWEK